MSGITVEPANGTLAAGENMTLALSFPQSKRETTIDFFELTDMEGTFSEREFFQVPVVTRSY